MSRNGATRPTGPLLDVRAVSKRFGAVLALDDVSLELRSGEILAVLGDNGAGKSTLIKGLSGVLSFDEGEVLLDGAEFAPKTPLQARAAGIETVYQDLAVFDNLSPVANFYAGREVKGPFGWLREREMVRRTREALERLEVRMPNLANNLGLMSGGQRQAIACARAVAFASRVVVLDEPTAALGLREAANVLRMIRRLPEQGASVMLISHNLEHVAEVADRAVVLRQGRRIGEAAPTAENHERLVHMIVAGRPTSAPSTPGRSGASRSSTSTHRRSA